MIDVFGWRESLHSKKTSLTSLNEHTSSVWLWPHPPSSMPWRICSHLRRHCQGFWNPMGCPAQFKNMKQKIHSGTKRIAKNLQHEKSSKWHTLDTNESVCCSKVLSLTFKCKCHDFLPSFLHRRPFGVQKWLPTKWRTKLAWRPFGVFLASF